MTGTTEELLSAILQNITPCPEICDGEAPYTTTNSNIQNGLAMYDYGQLQGHSYTVSGATPCTVVYINNGGISTTLNQTGSASTICVKKVISNDCTIFTKGNACF